MTAEDALREIVRVIEDTTLRPTRRIDRIYRILVQAGVIATK